MPPHSRYVSEKKETILYSSTYKFFNYKGPHLNYFIFNIKVLFTEHSLGPQLI